MRNIESILAPADFSDTSRAAVEYAVALGSALGAKVDVVHAFSTPAWAPKDLRVEMANSIPKTLEELSRTEAAERLESFLGRLELGPGAQHPGAHLEHGDPAESILKRVEDFDLVVVGTHGRTGMSHVLVGSVAEKIVRHASRPVITVRGRRALWSRALSRERAAPISRILVGTDLSPGSRIAIAHGAALAARLNASLVIAHAMTHVPIEGADLLVVSFGSTERTPFKDWACQLGEEQAKAFLASMELPVKPELRVRIGNPVEILLETARAEECDLVVVGTHGRTGFARLLVGSVAERLVRLASCPVLTIRAV